jgi:hypothetical protein
VAWNGSQLPTQNTNRGQLKGHSLLTDERWDENAFHIFQNKNFPKIWNCFMKKVKLFGKFA